MLHASEFRYSCICAKTTIVNSGDSPNGSNFHPIYYTAISITATLYFRQRKMAKCEGRLSRVTVFVDASPS